MNVIPYGRQHITEEDLEAVKDVLLSDFLTQGPAVSKFEKDFADYVGSKYAVAVSNGTTALHLSALALNVTTGTKVIVTPITFAASANCILYCGGEVQFADIHPETYCLDYEKVKEMIESHPKGTYSGLIAVDLAGYPVDLEKMRALADKHGLWIIEDACHAPGGAFLDSKSQLQKCGNSHFANLAVFSFHPVKHIASGEGGMITTNDRALYEKLLLLRTHGITKDPAKLEDNQGGWYYEMQELGYNYRMPDILCALGSSQLKRAGINLRRREAIAKRYDRELEGLPLKLPMRRAGDIHAFHLYVIQTEKRKELYDFLKQNNIYAQVHYAPISDFPYYRKKGFSSRTTPVAKAYYDRCLSIPMYHSMNEDEQSYVIQKIKEFFKK